MKIDYVITQSLDDYYGLDQRPIPGVGLSYLVSDDPLRYKRSERIFFRDVDMEHPAYKRLNINILFFKKVTTICLVLWKIDNTAKRLAEQKRIDEAKRRWDKIKREK